MELFSEGIGTYGLKIILALIPIVSITLWLVLAKSKSIRDEQEIKRRFNNLGGTLAEKSVSRFLKKEQKETFASKFNAQLNILGIENKFESLSLWTVVVFFVAAIISNLLIGAGYLLMIYFGFLAIATVYVFTMNKITKTRKNLREEFMEKLRDISSQMSVGLNFQTAISEILLTGKTSLVMTREFEKIRDSIATGTKYSEAFMKMYNNLQILEIKDFAQMCSVYEETGGQFVGIIHSFEDGYKMKRQMTQELEVFTSSMQGEQKITIGVPVLSIIGFAIVMPEAIRTYYSSFYGQLIGILLFSMIYFGSIVMSRYLNSGGDE